MSTTGPSKEVKARIWSRLQLYAAALELAHSVQDYSEVEPIGVMVAVQDRLVRNLQLAIKTYELERAR